MTDNEKTAALVGYGHAGRILGAYALTHTAGVRLNAVVDPDPCAREASEREVCVSQTFATIGEYIQNGELADIIWIAHHAPEHCNAVLSFIQAGCKHIVCEKPLSANLSQARSIVDCVKTYGVTFTVNEEHRFRAPFLASKQAILDGRIGDIVAVDMWGKGRRPPYELIEMLGHMTQQSLEVLESLGGMLVCADATIIEQGGRLATLDDVRDLTEGRPCGLGVGSLINASYYFSGVQNSGEVVVSMRLEEIPRAVQGDQRPGVLFSGTNGAILVREYDAWVASYTRYDLKSVGPDVAKWECLAGDINTPYVLESAQESSRALLEDFVVAINTEREPTISAEHAYNAFEMIRAPYYAHFNGGRVMFPLVVDEEPF